MDRVKLKIWILWLFTVFFFSYQFVLRLTPGVLIDDIMVKYDVSASVFGLIISFYYIGYAGMQIPVGILLDRFGVRYVVAISALVCVLGNLPLLFSDHWAIELLGRFFIGIGSAAGALGAIHIVRMNFPHRHMSKMIGFTVTIGLFGAIYGKSINRFLVESFGLEQSIVYLSIPGVLVAIIMFLFFKGIESQRNENLHYYSVLNSLKIIFQNNRIIWLAIAGALMVGPIESFADIFGESYLVHVYNFTPSDAGYLTASAMYFGFCVGAPLLAAIADRFNCHYAINITCGIVMTGAFHLMLEQLIVGYRMMYMVAFIIGIMSAYQVIVISSVSELVPANLTGTAIAVVNMFNMGAGMIFNTAIGALLDNYWTGEIINDKRIYSEIAYSDALYILPVTLMFGAIIFFVLKPNNYEKSVVDI